MVTDPDPALDGSGSSLRSDPDPITLSNTTWYTVYSLYYRVFPCVPVYSKGCPSHPGSRIPGYGSRGWGHPPGSITLGSGARRAGNDTEYTEYTEYTGIRAIQHPARPLSPEGHWAEGGGPTPSAQRPSGLNSRQRDQAWKPNRVTEKRREKCLFVVLSRVFSCFLVFFGENVRKPSWKLQCFTESDRSDR